MTRIGVISLIVGTVFGVSIIVAGLTNQIWICGGGLFVAVMIALLNYKNF